MDDIRIKRIETESQKDLAQICDIFDKQAHVLAQLAERIEALENKIGRHW